jgi:hypothetical protein
MKKIFTTLFLAIISVSILFAQSPDKISYQAVIRDNNNHLAQLQEIGMQISILQGSVNGTAVYVERHFPKTNENGLVTVIIGDGTVISGDFTTIDWSAGPYFLKTETDLHGGANYTISGTSQLLSVPYALYAKTAKSLEGGIVETDPIFDKSAAKSISVEDITKWNNKQGPMLAGDGISFYKNKLGITTVSETHYKVGDYAHDGVVFYVDESGEHGLVVLVKTEDYDDYYEEYWCKYKFSTWARDYYLYSGFKNSMMIIAAMIAKGYDPHECAAYSKGDSYLPSAAEMRILSKNLDVVNETIVKHNGKAIPKKAFWTSSEYDKDNARLIEMGTINERPITPKTEEHYVLYIRRF